MADGIILGDGAWIHPTAIVEGGVEIGARTKVWDGVHIRHGARIGRDGIVGEKSYVAYDVVIGDLVKINAHVYVCAAVTIEDACMISAGVTFTNDRYPRACNEDETSLQTSDPTDETLATRVERGVTIGANATIGPGITLGRYAMIGMGAVVTKDVPPHAVVLGNPARVRGHVCRCGHPLAPAAGPPGSPLVCARCGLRFEPRGSGLAEAGRP
jgi:acetyltransferase-like isoleucine patch superfamily enzyme